MRNEPWVWPEVRDAGTSGAGAVPLRSAQLMGQQQQQQQQQKKPSSVIVESQEECAFSKSILKSPSTRISAWGLTVLILSIICTQLSNHS